MANTIKQKRGTSDPSASDLVVGELAINTTDGSVFTKTDGGSVVEAGANVSHFLRSDVNDTLAGNIGNTSTSYFQVSVGTTAQRPGSPSQGMIRFNTTRSCFEGYTGSSWVNMSPLNVDDVGATS
ncbi:endosialidase [uncultured Mediterranean phage uvMED]|nr:endosialidase [uncultured Mediterranean phage uvMED]